MVRLRKEGMAEGIKSLRKFRFHQSRCTFATEIAHLAIKVGGSINAIAIVKEFLLHKHESTSFKYIKFVEKTPIKIEIGNAFTRDFLGLLGSKEDDT
ncbi:integrase [Pseudomonas sp. MWU13-2860]|nr:integrase [Pseudomonas sp. MWU13-2860]